MYPATMWVVGSVNLSSRIVVSIGIVQFCVQTLSLSSSLCFSFAYLTWSQGDHRFIKAVTQCTLGACYVVCSRIDNVLYLPSFLALYS